MITSHRTLRLGQFCRMIWREDPADVRPMLATLADAPLTQPGLRVRAEVRRHPRADSRRRRQGQAGHVASGRGSATRRPAQFPSIVQRARASRAQARRPAAPRRRDRRARRRTDARRLSAHAGAHPPDRRAQGRRAARAAAAGGAHRCSTSCATATRTCAACRSPSAARGSKQRVRPAARPATLSRRASRSRWRRPRAARSARTREGWEGLIVKDARAPYHSGRRSPAWRKLKLAQPAGVRRRRLDRAAADAAVLRRAAARRARRDGQGALTYVGHTGTGFDQAELARVWKLLKARETEAVAVRRAHQDERAGPLGDARARRAGAVHRVDRRRQAAPSCLPRAAGRQEGGGCRAG